MGYWVFFYLNIFGILLNLNKKDMEKPISIHLGEYYEKLIREEVLSGRYDSESDVIKSALRVFEKEEIRARSLINALEKGEKGEKIHSFDRDKNLEDLHKAFIAKFSGRNQ